MTTETYLMQKANSIRHAKQLSNFMDELLEYKDRLQDNDVFWTTITEIVSAKMDTFPLDVQFEEKWKELTRRGEDEWFTETETWFLSGLFLLTVYMIFLAIVFSTCPCLPK